MKPQIKKLFNQMPASKSGKRQYVLVVLSFLLSVLTLSGCKKFIDIPPPQTQLVTASVFNNAASATSAQLAIYTNMWNKAESYNMAEEIGVYGDELRSYATDVTDEQVYTNALVPASANSWNASYGGSNNYYTYIYAANAVIGGLQTISGCSPAVKHQLTGEAFFTRAFWHFYLTNLYGAVPLVLTTNYAVNATISRTPRVQVLQQVIADLETAKGMLNSNYVDGSDTVVTTARVRPTKAAAEALLARAYLYLGDYSNANAADYQKADSCATAVISNSAYSLSPLNSVFLENSTEAIWQLQTPSAPSAFFDTPDGTYFGLLGAPNTSGNRNSNTISSQLMGSFEPNDQRKTTWIGSFTAGTNIYYFPYKYKVINQSQNKEYVMVLRLAEQYLIRAEARVHEGDLAGAAADLNMIRTRAGLPNTSATTATDLAAAILHERQVELFTEWGARWFDLCRTGNAPSVMGPPGNVCQAKGGTWASDNHQLLWAVPQADLNADPSLKQNAGY